MLKKLIIIEKGKQYQINNEKELVKLLIDPNYYEMSDMQKLNTLKIKAISNSLNNEMEILIPDEIPENIDVNNKFILLNEKTYILSLMMTNNVTILERIDSNVYIKYLSKKNFTKNYIIVNNFAKQILQEYLKSKINKKEISSEN